MKSFLARWPTPVVVSSGHLAVMPPMRNSDWGCGGMRQHRLKPLATTFSIVFLIAAVLRPSSVVPPLAPNS